MIRFGPGVRTDSTPANDRIHSQLTATRCTAFLAETVGGDTDSSQRGNANRDSRQCDVSPHPDLFIQQKLNKTPLDVGADRIARTAYAALTILGTLRAELGMPIPLARKPPMFHLSQRRRYIRRPLWSPIGSDRLVTRSEIRLASAVKLSGVAREAFSGESVPDLALSADLRDAAVCVLAGVDFIGERAMDPEDGRLAERAS